MDKMFADLEKEFPQYESGSDIFYTSGSGKLMAQVASDVYGLKLDYVTELNKDLN